MGRFTREESPPQPEKPGWSGMEPRERRGDFRMELVICLGFSAGFSLYVGFQMSTSVKG